MNHSSRRRRLAGALMIAGALAAGACGDDDATEAAGDPAAAAETDSEETNTEEVGDDSSLVGVCPSPLVIQTGWFPQAEYGPVYSLAGTDGVRDSGAGTYTGPLGDTGIDVEIRAGGPFLGDQSVTAQMYVDQDILLGTIDTDQVILNADQNPTVGVVGYFERSPLMLMFDPETYDFETIDEVGESGATVLHFSDETAIEYLAAAGVLDPEQLDASYTGAPDRFISAQGEALSAGFISQDPFRYEEEYTDWGRPVESLLIHDSGFQPYANMLSARPESLEEHADCLAAVVPMVQQAVVDFETDHEPILEQIRLLNEEINDFWQTSDELNAEAVSILFGEGLFANSPDGTVGKFDMDRVGDLIDQVVPVFEGAGQDVPDDLTAEDVVTNEFVDDSIALP